MDKINIGSTILYLRKNKNLTQEQLANMLGISPGAVSKWENGNSIPDITLLPPLARALDTSLDNLLSYKQELSETEAYEIKQKLINIFLKNGYNAGEAECWKYLKEYPNSTPLKFNIAGLLDMYLMMSDKLSDEALREKYYKILALYKDTVSKNNPKYTPAALFLIAGLQMKLGNLEESEKALRELPQSPIDPMLLYPTLYQRQGKTKEAKDTSIRQLYQNLHQSCHALITLANISSEDKNYEEALSYLNEANKIQEAFNLGIDSIDYIISKLYLETGNKKAALEWFKSYAEKLLSSDYDYSKSKHFKAIELSINREGQKIIRERLIKALLEADEFSPLAGIADYEASVERLRASV